MRQAGLFGLSDHLKRLSAYGDLLKNWVGSSISSYSAQRWFLRECQEFRVRVGG